MLTASTIASVEFATNQGLRNAAGMLSKSAVSTLTGARQSSAANCRCAASLTTTMSQV